MKKPSASEVPETSNPDSAPAPGDVIQKDRLSEFLSRDVVVIALFSGFSYYLAYEFQAAFLRYYGISETFVEIDVVRLAFVASATASLVVFVWNFVYIIPLKPLKRIALASLMYVHTLFMVALLTLSFIAKGFSWLTLILFVIAIASAFLDILVLVHSRRRGSTWKEYVDENIDAEIKARNFFVGTRMLDGVPGGVALAVACLVLLPPVLGAWAGAREASNRSDYMEARIGDENYLLIAPYQDGFIGVEKKSVGRSEGEVELTGVSRYVEMSHLNDRRMERIYPVHVERYPLRENEYQDWVSFSEMLLRISSFVD